MITRVDQRRPGDTRATGATTSSVCHGGTHFARVFDMTRLDHRVKGLESRLAELRGEAGTSLETKIDKLTADVAELREQLGEVLALLKAQHPAKSD